MTRAIWLEQRGRQWFRTPAHFVFAAAMLAIGLSVTAEAKTVTLGAADNHTSICLVEGDTLVVTLPSPLGPAYRWKLNLEKSSPLTSVREFESPGGAKGSDAQTQTFRLNAASAGRTTLVLSLKTGGLDSAQQGTETFSVDVSVASGEPVSLALIGIYKGATACADCTGIQTELRLYAKGKFDFTDTIYLSTRTYQGGRNGDQSFTDRGQWAVLKGDAVNPNATVYELNPDQPGQAEYLLLEPGGGALTELDRQMKPIDAPAMYKLVLKRVD